MKAYFERDPVDYARWWITVYNAVYDAAKAVRPNTQIGPIFQYENLSGQGQLNGWNTSHWGALEAHHLTCVDILGLTVYPFLNFETGSEVPETYLDAVVEWVGAIPLAITETGWLAQALGELSPAWQVSEQQQVDYLGALARIVKRHVRLPLMFTRDPMIDQSLLMHLLLWCVTLLLAARRITSFTISATERLRGRSNMHLIG